MPPDSRPAAAPYWKCVLAAIPTLLVAAEFGFAGMGRYLPGRTRDAIAGMMAVEFEVLMLGALVAFAALSMASTAAARRALVVVAAILLTIIVSIAGSRNSGVVFLALAVSTYGGLLLTWRSPTARIQLVLRWVVGLGVFIFACAVFALPGSVSTWAGLRRTLDAGCTYFLILGLIELSGLYLIAVPLAVARYRRKE